MRRLPLYKTFPVAEVMSGQALSLNSDCTRCALFRTARKRCIPAEGKPGGVLLVGKQVGPQEDIKGRANVGTSGQTLRKCVAKHWSGPVAYDNATRCFPGKNRDQTDAQIELCRPYLKQTIMEVQPTRIVALGGDAVFALFGRRVPIMSVRRGHAWLTIGDRSVPVLMTIHPAAGERNSLVMREFEQDIEWVLTCDDPSLPPWNAEYFIIETKEDAEQAVDDIRIEAPWFAYDLEWGGTPQTDYFEIVSAAVCSSGVDTAYVWSKKALNDPAVRQPLLDLLADPEIGVVGHNVKGDNNSIEAAYGVRVRGTYGDSRLWRRLLVSNADGRLSVCAELVGMGGHKDESEEELERVEARIAKARKNSNTYQVSLFIEDSELALDAAVREPDVSPLRFAYALMDTGIRDRYCARDAVATARLGDLLDEQVSADEGANHVWQSVGRRATDAIAQMERWGMAADRSAVQSLQEMLNLELGQVLARLSSYGDFNPSSPADVAELLFSRLGLRSTEKTNGGKPSTASDVLKKLKGKHPVIEDLLYYRKLAKYKGDYGDKLGRYIRNDGRIHPELKIDGTKTGRLSCVEPPLHSLPRAETELSRSVKRCFVAPPGRLIVVADYSQIEYRIAAMLSGDPVMRDMFISGEDFHTATAKLIARTYWGIDPSAVGKKERRDAKDFNFGLLYGMTDNGLAKRLGTSVQEAKRLRAAIMGAWKVLARWIDQCKKEVRQTGYCWTWWAGKRARKRPLFGIRSKDSRHKSTAENSAVNTPVQGTANEYMVASICEIVEWIWAEDRPEKLGLTVHDSVVAEVPIPTLHEYVGTAREIMLGHDSRDVPLRADFEVATTYGDLKPYVEPV